MGCKAMVFNELEKKMRIYEQSPHQILLPETYMVVRLGGRGFTRLTKEIWRAMRILCYVMFQRMLLAEGRESTIENLLP